MPCTLTRRLAVVPTGPRVGRFAWGLLLPGLLLGGTLAPPKAMAQAPEALPAARGLVDRHIAASGGREAIARIRSVHDIGTLELPAVGISATAESHTVVPKQTVTRATIPGIGEITAGTDGTVGWSVNPLQGPRVLVDRELAQVIESADLQANLLFPEASFRELTTEARVDFAGEAAYRVRMVRRDSGRESWRYFSVGTGLLIGSEMTTVSDLGEVRTTLAYRDFRPLDGVLFPMRIETTAGSNRMVLTVREKTLNRVSDTVFSVPETVRALVRR